MKSRLPISPNMPEPCLTHSASRYYLRASRIPWRSSKFCWHRRAWGTEFRVVFDIVVPNRKTMSCKRPIVDGVIPTMAMDNREFDKSVLSSRCCKRGQQGNPGL
jgi:hypothetical protein